MPQRISLVIVMALLLAPTLHAAEASADKDKQIQVLLDRITTLEKKVAELEQRLSKADSATPASATIDRAKLSSLQTKARARMAADRTHYSADQLREVENLYQPSNDRARRGSPEIIASLEKLIANYPKANRTGCAQLYLAQWKSGDEREQALKDAAEKFGDCWYGDGCQVGPYARFQLGQYYVQQNQPDKAKEQFEKIRTETPDAVDHGGQSLVSQIPAT